MAGTMNTKVAFGRRGREEAKKTDRMPTLMERLKKIAKRWWPGQRLNKGDQAAKQAKPRSLPQRRPQVLIGPP
jgi:hypothetical protein